jgi:hypothetical protein
LEVTLEDVLDVGKGIEPFDDFRAGEVVFEVAAKLVTALFGETTDFSDVSHRI